MKFGKTFDTAIHRFNLLDLKRLTGVGIRKLQMAFTWGEIRGGIQVRA